MQTDYNSDTVNCKVLIVSCVTLRLIYHVIIHKRVLVPDIKGGFKERGAWEAEVTPPPPLPRFYYVLTKRYL